MGAYELTLKMPDGTLIPVEQRIKELKRDLNRVYKKGLNNNNTVSNKDATNLQRNLIDTLKQLKENQGDIDEEAGTLSAFDYLRYQRLAKATDHLTSTIGQVNSLFTTDQYQSIQRFTVSSSKVYQDDTFARQRDANEVSNKELGRSVKNIALRATTQQSRWNTSVDTGVVTQEKYNEYLANNQYTQDQLVETRKQLKAEQINQQRQYDQLNALQTIIQNRFNSKQYDPDEVVQLARIREELKNLSKSKKYLDELDDRLTKAQESLQSTEKAMKDQTRVKGSSTTTIENENDSIKVLSGENTLSGYIRNHRSLLVRGAVRTAVVGGVYQVKQGSSARLTNFNNVAGVMYSRGVNDGTITRTLMNNKLGMTLDESSAYLNAYTSNTGNGKLSNKEISKLTNTWGTLALTNGASSDTVTALLATASLTNTQGLSASGSRRLANAIQNSLTNSNTSAKANEQLNALTSIYQTAATSGTLTTNDQINLAGFQAMMGSTGSSWQGNAGAQAYSGLANISNSSNNQNQQLSLWLDNTNFGGYNQNSQVTALRTAQRAKSDPYLYKTPIGNLYRTARQQTRKRADAEAITTQNLVTLSGGQLSYEQASKLVKLYANGQFTRSNIRKRTKGKGVNASKYKKTGTSSIRKNQEAIQASQIKASKSLDGLRRKLGSFTHYHPVLGAIGYIGAGALTAASANLTWGLINSGTLSTVGRGAKNVAKAGISRISSLPRAGKIGGAIGLGIGAGLLLTNLMTKKAKADTRTNQVTSRQVTRRTRHKKKNASILDSAKSTLSRFLSQFGIYKAKHKDLHSQQKQLIKHLQNWFNQILKKVKNYAKNNTSSSNSEGDVSNDGATASKEYWLKKAKQVAKAMGVNISDAQLELLMKLIQGESGYNEKAVQSSSVYDVNIANGNPAQGLLQFIPQTFKKYAVKSHENILSGVDQLYAFFNIASWANNLTGHAGWSPSGPTRGYENGGIVRHAQGGYMQSPLRSLQTEHTTPTTNTDISALATRYSTIHQPTPRPKVIRNQPQIKVTINTTQATPALNKSAMIDEVISSTFSDWVTKQQNQQLLNYYAN